MLFLNVYANNTGGGGGRKGGQGSSSLQPAGMRRDSQVTLGQPAKTFRDRNRRVTAKGARAGMSRNGR